MVAHYMITMRYDGEYSDAVSQALLNNGYQKVIDGIQLPEGVFFVKQSKKMSELSVKREIIDVIEQTGLAGQAMSVVIAKIDGFLMPFDYPIE